MSMMTLFVHFHSTTHVIQILMIQLQYDREFMRSVKETLKRSYPWSGYYFNNRKGCWYPPAERCIDYRKLTLVLPKKPAFVYIAVSKEEKWQTWADCYTRAVCQRTVGQKATMVKTGTLPHYLYSSKINEVAKTTEAYSPDMVRPSDVEKEVVKRDLTTWRVRSGEHRGRASRSIWLCKWRREWFASRIDQCCQPGRRIFLLSVVCRDSRSIKFHQD